jgi:hypothetical protein
MVDNPDKTTIGTNHVQSLQLSIKALEKIATEATQKNKDDANAKTLNERLKKLKEGVGELKPAKTQLAVYEGVKTRIKQALTDFPKLAKLVKKAGEDEKPAVKVTVKFANSKVQSACNGNSSCKARIDEVANHGPGYLGHKAVSGIKAQGHIHVGNQNGVAFNWKGAELTIVAYGTKTTKGKPGMSGYDWVT